MSGEHTKGPWTQYGFEVRTGDGNSLIANCGISGSLTEAEMLANAALIQSAPDLLEALEAALPRLAHQAKCHSVRPAAEWFEHGSASFENCSCEIAQVRAALLRARAK